VSAVHSGISRNKDDALSANIFLTSLSAMTSHFYSVRLSRSAGLRRPCWFFKTWVADHYAVSGQQLCSSLTRTSYTDSVIGAIQLKLCRNLRVSVNPTNLRARCTCANLCVGRKCPWCNVCVGSVHSYSTSAEEALHYHLRQHHICQSHHSIPGIVPNVCILVSLKQKFATFFEAVTLSWKESDVRTPRFKKSVEIT